MCKSIDSRLAPLVLNSNPSAANSSLPPLNTSLLGQDSGVTVSSLMPNFVKNPPMPTDWTESGCKRAGCTFTCTEHSGGTGSPCTKAKCDCGVDGTKTHGFQA